MLLADSNIWMAFAIPGHVFHSTVEEWLLRGRAGDPVCFCRATQQSFLRLLTTAATLAPYGLPALSNSAAWSQYERMRADDRIGWLDEPGGLELHWKKCSGRRWASPKLWMDAYLAAFAIAGKYKLVTTDKAFKQYKGLDLLLLPNG